MGLADAAIHGIVNSLAFQASAAPYLLLDTEFRILAPNPAYQRATLRDTSDVTGEWLFDVFPDNPATPQARGVERLGRSLEQALHTGGRDRMELQRYDVRDPHTGAFVEKSWLPSNSPIRDADGRTLGVLHHVEDVTHLLIATALERDLVGGAAQAADPAIGTRALVELVRRDSVARSTRAEMLMDQSQEAIDRISRRSWQRSRK